MSYKNWHSPQRSVTDRIFLEKQNLLENIKNLNKVYIPFDPITTLLEFIQRKNNLNAEKVEGIKMCIMVPCIIQIRNNLKDQQLRKWSDELTVSIPCFYATIYNFKVRLKCL